MNIKKEKILQLDVMDFRWLKRLLEIKEVPSIAFEGLF